MAFSSVALQVTAGHATAQLEVLQYSVCVCVCVRVSVSVDMFTFPSGLDAVVFHVGGSPTPGQRSHPFDLSSPRKCLASWQPVSDIF